MWHAQNNNFFGRTRLERIRYVLPCNLPNEISFSILGNSEISGKSQSFKNLALCSASLLERRLWPWQINITEELLWKLFYLFHFCLIFLLFPINFFPGLLIRFQCEVSNHICQKYNNPDVIKVPQSMSCIPWINI